MSTQRDTLVIGGAGFIGTPLSHQLCETGRTITVLDYKAPRPPGLPESAAYVSGDFNHVDLISQLLDRHQEVIHLAYATVPNTSYSNPLGDLQENLPPAVRLFEEAARRERKLLFVSSGGTVYGQAESCPISEDAPTQPISPYGLTKLTLEQYAHLYSVIRGLDYICVRPANAYGVGQRPFVGQGFISTAMATALKGDTIHIFGQAGTVRDYVYVTDLAAGIVAALSKGESSRAYNLGTGVGRTNMDVIQAIRPLVAELGIEVQVEHLEERVFDVKANVLDASRLRDECGWAPRVSFEDGLRQTLDWLRSAYA